MAFNGRFVLNLIRFAELKGADTSGLYSQIGLTEEELNVEGCIVSDSMYSEIVISASLHAEDPCFGLHAGEHLNLAAAGLIGQITQTCATVKEAIEYCCTFANLGCSALPMSLEERIDYYEVIIDPKPDWKQKHPDAARHTIEGYLAFTLREFRALTHHEHHPLSIHVYWDASSCRHEYQRIFNCPVYDRSDRVSILFRREHVEEPISTADYELLRILVKHAEKRLEELKRGHGIIRAVEQAMIYLSHDHFPSLEHVAQHLNLSSRTLQRKLHTEKTTYKEILDRYRRTQAYAFLENTQMSIQTISEVLLYSDPSAFIRSFRRWTGDTPDAWRGNTG